MNEKQPWFVNERAMALASLLLTSRSDVVVQHSTKEDRDIDILVEVLKDHSPVGRFFGVQVIGRLDLPNIQQIDDHRLRPARRKHLAEFAIPLCVFLFDVRRNKGFYRWLVEPVVSDGEPRLGWPDETEWEILDEQVIHRMIDRIAAWYDALATQLRP